MFFQKNKNFFLTTVVFLLMVAFGAESCVKTEFDQPPVGGDGKDIPTNISIKDLKKLHSNFTGGYRAITEDFVIGGTVVMDDRSGNYYKAIVIQDSTGGIELRFSNGFLYNRYPIGRKIYVRCKGLMLTDYRGNIQLTGGYYEENGQRNSIGITELQETENIVRGFMGAVPAPKKVSIGQLTIDMVNTLVQVENVQFTKCDMGKVFADAVNRVDINRSLEQCPSGGQLYLRSSSYSTFASETTPTGQGNATGVLGIYSSNSTVEPTDFQLYVRDTRDLDMNGPRCDAAIGGTLNNISEIRSLFTGTTISMIPGSRKIKGIVISDRVGNNLNGRNLFLQDGSAGIVVRFTENHCYDLGDEIEVEVSGLELSEFQKLLQVNNVPPARAIRIGSGRTVTPRVVTVAELNANYETWESTLVRIADCMITPAGSLAGSKTASDGTGSITLFTSASATFANTPVPANAVTLTAIVSDFNGKQILLRNTGDIQ